MAEQNISSNSSTGALTPTSHRSSPVKVVVTGASGDIGSQVAMRIARGDLFGPDTIIELTLVAAKADMNQLTKGTLVEFKTALVKSELSDIHMVFLNSHTFAGPNFKLGLCNLPPLRSLKSTNNLQEAFRDAQYILLAGGVPANPVFTRNDLIGSNTREFKDAGVALQAVENRKARILVVTEPQNINMVVLWHFAPYLDPRQVTGLSRVDHNRSVSKLARMLSVSSSKVTCVSVFGNSGGKVFPDLRHAKVQMLGKDMTAYQAVGDDYYLKFDFVTEIHARTGEIYKRQNTGPSMTIANAVIQHMKDWVFGTPTDNWTSMVVFSDGSYEIDKGLPYSFPVRIDKNGECRIVDDLDIDFFEKERLIEAMEHIQIEKNFAWATMGLTDNQDSEEKVPLTWSFGCNNPVPCRILGPLERQRMNYF